MEREPTRAISGASTALSVPALGLAALANDSTALIVGPDRVFGEADGIVGGKKLTVLNGIWAR